MPHNRHTVRAQLNLKPEIAHRFRDDSSLRIMMYCGLSQTMGPDSNIDISFPNQIEVKVNDMDVKSNFKGMKNKPGTTKPADITSFVRKFSSGPQSQPNNIQITYALTTKRYSSTLR